MKVFVVIECGYYSVNDVLCNTLGVHTSLEKAKEEMLECHKQAIESIDKEFVSNISSYVVDMECAIFYKNKGVNEIAQHFVSIIKREIQE
jgi:hypothetical protein